MEWTLLDFGKYETKSLPEIIFSDPDYFIWCFEHDIFRRTPQLESESEFLYERIRSIKIPDNANRELVAQFSLDKDTGELKRLKIIPVYKYKTKLDIYRSSIIDLTFPRTYNYSDPHITKWFLKPLFSIIFQDFHHQPSKTECEDFFNNDDNFGL